MAMECHSALGGALWWLLEWTIMRASLWPVNGQKGGRLRERRGKRGVSNHEKEKKKSEMHLGSMRKTGCLFQVAHEKYSRPML